LVKEHKPLTSGLLAWRAEAHSNDPLSPVQPPSFIIDNQGIKALAKLHPLNVTNPEKIVTMLDQTPEWQDLWSRQLFDVIQAYDRELSDHRKDEAARNKARQKRAKHEQDQVRFTEVSNEIAKRI
jgi:hypothetical protein